MAASYRPKLVRSSWPPNWYVDPWDHGQWRYWDGAFWTGHTSERYRAQKRHPSPDHLHRAFAAAAATIGNSNKKRELDSDRIRHGDGMDGPLGVQLDLERLCPVLSDVPIEVTRPLYQLLSSERVHHRKLRAHLAERERHLAYMNSGMREIDAMPGVNSSATSRPDIVRTAGRSAIRQLAETMGVDLIATKDGELDLAIQCKKTGETRWSVCHPTGRRRRDALWMCAHHGYKQPGVHSRRSKPRRDPQLPAYRPSRAPRDNLDRQSWNRWLRAATRFKAPPRRRTPTVQAWSRDYIRLDPAG